MPTKIEYGEPFVDIYSGRLFFSGYPGGSYTSISEQAGVFEIGGTNNSTQRTLTAITTSVGNVGAGEDGLMSYSMPVNTMSVDNCSIEITAFGITTNNVNVKTIKLYFGSTVIASGSLTAAVAGNWLLKANVIRVTSTTQKATAERLQSNTSDAVCFYTTPGETLANVITIKCTGEATDNNDIIQEGIIIKYNPAN